MAETTMAEMVCGRNVLWPNRSVAETSRKWYGDYHVPFPYSKYAHCFNMTATSLLKHSRLLRRICNHAGICFLRPSLQGYLISVELIGKKRNQSI